MVENLAAYVFEPVESKTHDRNFMKNFLELLNRLCLSVFPAFFGLNFYNLSDTIYLPVNNNLGGILIHVFEPIDTEIDNSFFTNNFPILKISHVKYF